MKMMEKIVGKVTVKQVLFERVRDGGVFVYKIVNDDKMNGKPRPSKGCVKNLNSKTQLIIKRVPVRGCPINTYPRVPGI
jgi:hypothetical protein